MQTKVVLITGGAKRIGAGIAEYLHQQGMNIIIHFRHSKKAAEQLVAKFNDLRPASAVMLYGDLAEVSALPGLIAKASEVWGYLDVLINNASSYYPTPLGSVTETIWNDLLASNVVAPFFLSQAAIPILSARKGCIINIVDIKAEQPSRLYSVYCIAKSGLWTLTKALAKELAPTIRVNALAPGLILRPEQDALSDAERAAAINLIPFKRAGEVEDLAKAAYFLIEEAPYVTGQMLAIDGGRSLYTGEDHS
jgi:pteridine reductase